MKPIIKMVAVEWNKCLGCGEDVLDSDYCTDCTCEDCGDILDSWERGTGTCYNCEQIGEED